MDRRGPRHAADHRRGAARNHAGYRDRARPGVGYRNADTVHRTSGVDAGGGGLPDRVGRAPGTDRASRYGPSRWRQPPDGSASTCLPAAHNPAAAPPTGPEPLSEQGRDATRHGPEGLRSSTQTHGSRRNVDQLLLRSGDFHPLPSASSPRAPKHDISRHIAGDRLRSPDAVSCRRARSGTRSRTGIGTGTCRAGRCTAWPCGRPCGRRP